MENKRPVLAAVVWEKRNQKPVSNLLVLLRTYEKQFLFQQQELFKPGNPDKPSLKEGKE